MRTSPSTKMRRSNESVRVHVILDTVDNSQLVLSQTSTGFGAVVLIAVWISEGLLCLETL